MSDRLAEIRERWLDKQHPCHATPDNDVGWLVGEMERLRGLLTSAETYEVAQRAGVTVAEAAAYLDRRDWPLMPTPPDEPEPASYQSLYTRLLDPRPISTVQRVGLTVSSHIDQSDVDPLIKLAAGCHWTVAETVARIVHRWLELHGDRPVTATCAAEAGK